MSNKEQTYLQLAPEFGGTKFGPFLGVEIRLGSDPSANDITLPEAYGIAPQHVKILIQKDGSFIIAPTERSATVYAYRGHGRPKQVTSPMAVGPGDAFSLATPEGPRFFLLMERPKDAGDGLETPQDALDAARAGLTGGGILEELKRVGLAKVVTSNVGHFLQNAYTFIKSGTFLKPRYIVMGMGIASGWVLAGGASCAAVGFQQSAASSSSDLTQCETDLDAEQGRSGALEDQTIPGLAASVLGDRLRWNDTFLGDDEFRTAFKAEYKKILNNKQKREKLNWVRHPSKSREFVQFKSALENSQMPANLTRVMSFLAAPEEYIPDREWSMVMNSSGDRSCGRGSSLMTYRQASNLGLAPLQVDALVDQAIALGSDLDAKRAALVASGGAGLEFVEDEIAAEGVGKQGMKQCLHIAGEDGRSDSRQVATVLGNAFGANAPRLPEEGDEFWQLSRIMSYFAADAGYGYKDLNFSSNIAPSVVLDDMVASEKDYVMSQSASLVARAVAVYCIAALDTEAEMPEHLPDPPGEVDCLILNHFVITE